MKLYFIVLIFLLGFGYTTAMAEVKKEQPKISWEIFTLGLQYQNGYNIGHNLVLQMLYDSNLDVARKDFCSGKKVLDGQLETYENFAMNLMESFTPIIKPPFVFFDGYMGGTIRAFEDFCIPPQLDKEKNTAAYSFLSKVLLECETKHSYFFTYQKLADVAIQLTILQRIELMKLAEKSCKPTEK